jgi:aldose sugar dehydrogenase
MKIMLLILSSFLTFAIIYSSLFTSNEGHKDYYYQGGRNHDDQYLSFIGDQSPETRSLTVQDNQTISKKYDQDQSSQLDNQSELIRFGLRSFEIDSQKSCKTIFKCNANLTAGWNDHTSIQFSTNNTEHNRSWIIGQEVDVTPKGRYQFVFHMKLNEWVTESRVILNGYNETSKQWYRMNQCPSVNVNGPLEWQEFSCGITLEANTTKIRPILNAGWSSQPNREATTWFDSIYLTKFRPFLTDPKLTTEVVYQGLDAPIVMGFLGLNDFLVTGGNGTVLRIVNGVETSKQMLDHNVDMDILGLAISNNFTTSSADITNGSTYVFVYFTPNKKGHEDFAQGKGVLSNRLYRYELENNTLVYPKLMLELPAGYHHDGGPILISPDNKSLYLSVGDIENQSYKVVANKALNNKTGSEPDGTGGILRVTHNGKPVHESVLGNTYPLNLYYAYGIRESFGMDFDPLSGKLWNTENGADWGDEMNLVEMGFNGGWNKVQGIWNINDPFNASDIANDYSDMVDFDGNGIYSSPEFVWKYTVAPTALIFLSTDKMGKEYENDMFVGDVNNGRIYHFKLNENRTALLLKGPLMDKIADTDKELESVVFAEGFGIITDLKIGPDGFLYFVVYDEGKIYRVVPRNL